VFSHSLGREPPDHQLAQCGPGPADGRDLLDSPIADGMDIA
jgi:hypothetical protein